MDAATQGRTARFPALPSYATIMNQTITPGIQEIFGQKAGIREGLTDLQRRTQAMLDEDLWKLGLTWLQAAGARSG